MVERFLIGSRWQHSTVNECPCVYTTMPDRFHLYRDVVKRLIDIVCSVMLLIILSPLLAAIAICVWAACGRPILFRDIRAGRHGRPFTIHKFRTMRDAADSTGDPLSDATRLTRLGQLLRRTSLDELPQLWNVLAGDMSFIGPRPLPLRYLDRYTARQATRLTVRPGLTGLAQINGRNSIPWPVRLELDAIYVDALRSPFAPVYDLWITTATVVLLVWHAISGRGINAPGSVTMPEFMP